MPREQHGTLWSKGFVQKVLQTFLGEKGSFVSKSEADVRRSIVGEGFDGSLTCFADRGAEGGGRPGSSAFLGLFSISSCDVVRHNL